MAALQVLLECSSLCYSVLAFCGLISFLLQSLLAFLGLQLAYMGSISVCLQLLYLTPKLLFNFPDILREVD